MIDIKFRIWDGRFNSFRYWGFIEDYFVSIPSGSGLNLEECKSKSEMFTGLKDKNGIEIYEGDIIKRVISVPGFDPNTTIEEVLFEGACFVTKVGLSKDTCYLADFYLHTIEVIGNIHQNTELL